MKTIVCILAVAAILCFATNADAGKNGNGKFALHFAGGHDAKTNDCTPTTPFTDCRTSPTGQLVVDGPGPGHYDVYLLAIDVIAIAGSRYGIVCTGTTNPYFYSWTKCSDLEIPSDSWPGCGENNAQAWGEEVAGPIVVMGIFDIYVYAGLNSMCTTIDSRVAYAEWCDGAIPEPFCHKTTDINAFGCVGFNGTPGVNHCGEISVQQTSWGTIKALYK